MAKKKAAVASVTALNKEFENGVTIEYVKEIKATAGEGYDLVVKFKNFNEEHPFHATPVDVELHGKWLYEQAKAGAFGAPAAYERPLPTVEDLQAELDKLMPDVILGLATEDELALAKNLRIQIKAMS